MTQRVALITGAGSGIGRAVAGAFLKAGYLTALAGRRGEALQQTAELSGAATNALVLPTDVTDPGAVRSLFDRVVDRGGRLDVLFNNAGIGAPPVPLEELTAPQWLDVVNVNLNGMFWCMQQAFRVMKAQQPQGGRIINNGSISADAPRPNSAPYTATKHAVTGLTKSGSLDGRAFDIAVGQIDIGNAATEMTAKMEKGTLQAHGQMAPERRMPVQVVADAVLHMASLPLNANVLFMTVLETRMPYIGRG